MLLWRCRHRGFPMLESAAEHKVNEFFAAVEAQDFPKAFGIWNNDADWQQHTQRYAAAGYPYGRFVIDSYIAPLAMGVRPFWL